MLLLTACRTPAFAMFANPIEEGAFETDVVTESLGLDPLVLQNLFPLRQELLIKAGLLDEISAGRGLWCG